MWHINIDKLLRVLSTEQIPLRIVWFAVLFGDFIHDNAEEILQSILILCSA